MYIREMFHSQLASDDREKRLSGLKQLDNHMRERIAEFEKLSHEIRQSIACLEHDIRNTQTELGDNISATIPTTVVPAAQQEAQQKKKLSIDAVEAIIADSSPP